MQHKTSLFLFATAALLLTGEPSGELTKSYENLIPYVRWYEWGGKSITLTVTHPDRCGAAESPLVAILQNEDHRKALKLSDGELRRFYLWLDANAPFATQGVHKLHDLVVKNVAEGRRRDTADSRRSAAALPAGSDSNRDGKWPSQPWCRSASGTYPAARRAAGHCDIRRMSPTVGHSRRE